MQSLRPVRRVAELGSLGHTHSPMNEAGTTQPLDQEQVARKRRALLYVRVLRMFCFASAVWIGFENHWSGLAWIPVGALLFVAIVARVSAWICRWVIHLFVIFWRFRLSIEFYLLARKYRHLSPMNRGRLLAQMSPEFREHFLIWIRSHVA